MCLQVPIRRVIMLVWNGGNTTKTPHLLSPRHRHGGDFALVPLFWGNKHSQTNPCSQRPALLILPNSYVLFVFVALGQGFNKTTRHSLSGAFLIQENTQGGGRL